VAPLTLEQACQAATAIEDPVERCRALQKIAPAQAQAGRAEAARLTFDQARQAAGAIADPSLRSPQLQVDPLSGKYQWEIGRDLGLHQTTIAYSHPIHPKHLALLDRRKCIAKMYLDQQHRERACRVCGLSPSPFPRSKTTRSSRF
jgi:hypothetical protein